MTEAGIDPGSFHSLVVFFTQVPGVMNHLPGQGNPLNVLITVDQYHIVMEKLQVT